MRDGTGVGVVADEPEGAEPTVADADGDDEAMKDADGLGDPVVVDDGVGVCVGSTHCACTAKDLATLTHGSPRKATLLTAMVHELRPTHCATTMVLLFAALHEPTAKLLYTPSGPMPALHVPVGVPYDEKEMEPMM